MPRWTVIAIVWLTVIYIALVMQTGFASGIAFTAAVAAWAVTLQSRASGVLWAALAGLACDAAGHDRLGLHLATYAVLGAFTTSLIPDVHRRTGWAIGLTAAVIAGGDAFLSGALASQFGQDARTLPQIVGAALEATALTSGVVVLVVFVIWIVRRLLQPISPGRALQLANRWKMLTE